MKFIRTEFDNCYFIEIEKEIDQRGYFARTYDKDIFEKYGLNENFVQDSISINKKKYTLRGMHYQIQPYEEGKLVRCNRGKIFDVIIDLRKNSKTFKKWMSVELSEKNSLMIYIPKGFAHGFQTLEDNTEVSYQINQYYSPENNKGIRWNDSEFSIKWPNEFPILSEKDKGYPDFKENEF
jgi:dTDP-4-dehydrorhamnose 3,5-epimerase